MGLLKDIEHLDDVKLLVHDFYGKVRADILLSSIFNEVIQDRWPEHLEKMVCFWQTVLFDEHTYFGRPFPPHAMLPVDEHHFSRWVSLFFETVDTHFEGPNAERAKWQGERMAEMFHLKIQHSRGIRY